MASHQTTIVSSLTGKHHVPMEIAATLSLVTHGLATYDPHNDVKYIVCTGMDIMAPPGSLSITERASIERGNHYNRLWIRAKTFDTTYTHPPISMQSLRDGEFKCRIYTWNEIKQMVDNTTMVYAPPQLPAHIHESLQIGTNLPYCKAGGVIVMGGDIDIDSDASCLDNDPTNPNYRGVGLLEVIPGEQPFAIIANIAEYFVNRKGSIWVFKV